MKDALKDLQLLLKSRYGLIHLKTKDDHRAQVLLRHAADSARLIYYSWTPTKGLCRHGGQKISGTKKLEDALAHIEKESVQALYHLIGAADFLGDKMVQHILKDAAIVHENRNGALVLSDEDIDWPHSLKTHCASVQLPDPSLNELKTLLKRILRDLSARMPVVIKITNEEVNRLLQNLKGFTLMEAEKILTKVIVEDGNLSAEDIKKVVDAKKSIVEKDGLLEFYPVEDTLEDVADLKGLKSWLKKRSTIFADPDKAKKFGLPFPKGVLLLGVQGCGKSLCARAIASSFGLPLLRFDPSAMYNKYIGETEKNFKRAVKAAEKTAPVVLWIDEIEKAFSEGGEDGGVSTRVLGAFLTWMQDRKGDVFIVATANNIDRLRPEFLRKGRFDEIFFVDLPDASARKAIFEVHLRKRKRDPQAYDLENLSKASAGFSGSEIEQAIVAGLYTAFSGGSPLTSSVLLKEIQETRPLSVTMKEKVEKLKSWAAGRTVRAN